MAKKRYGQNFLTDTGMIERLVRFIDPQLDQHVVEIGPGQAALTRALLPCVKRLDALEVDADLIEPLRADLTEYAHCYIHQADALKYDFAKLGKAMRLVGNLPYNISTPLLFHFLRYADCFTDMHLMLQKEVVERACAKPGSKVYGRLSVMLQYYAKVCYLSTIPPSCFNPRPQVNSAFMRVIPFQSKPYEAHDESIFKDVVQKAFSQRRKTLRAIFKKRLTDTDWQHLAIDSQLRPECLALSDFVNLANYICLSK